MNPSSGRRWLWLLVVSVSVSFFAISCDTGTGTPQSPTAADPPQPPPEASIKAALAHLTVHASAYGFGPASNLQIGKVLQRRGRAHVRVQQTVAGVPVLGGEGIIHLDETGNVWRVTDNFLRGMPDVMPGAKISRADAIWTASFRSRCPKCTMDTAKADQWILRHGGRDRLVYRVQAPLAMGPDGPTMPVSFVDALNGDVVLSYENLQTGTGPSLYSGNVTVATYHDPGSGNYFLQDVASKFGTYDMGNTTTAMTSFSDPNDVWDAPGQRVALDAEFGMKSTLDYYRLQRNRLGINGSGGPLTVTAADGLTSLLTSRVHFSSNYNNAFWDGLEMTYGDGDGVRTGPFPTLDICGHELTHGVTQYSAGLIYLNESGALNEATSDIFGAMVERSVRGESNATWTQGEDNFTPGTPGDAMRYLNAPHSGNQPDHYSELVTGTGDNGGVHTNSGIANHAFYLMAHGGTHRLGGSIDLVGAPPTGNGQAIGADKAAAVWYLALTSFMTSSTDFIGAASATANAADELYGIGSPETQTVLKAWALCGLSADRTPPSASLIAPAGGQTLSGVVSVAANAADNLAVKAVEIWIDGNLRGTATAGSPYQVSWQSWLDGNGPHAVTAKAYDFNGNVGTSAPVSVTVANEMVAPAAAITAPANGGTATGATSVAVTATDNVGVTRVELWVDGVRRGTTTTAPFMFSWQTWLDGNGSHALVAKAFDLVGNVGTSTPVTQTVANETVPPTITLSAPVGGASVSGFVVVRGVVTDNSGLVDRVDYYADGVFIGTRPATGALDLLWDSGAVNNGSHVLTARAFDFVQNQATSAPVTVTVNNANRAAYDAVKHVPTCDTIGNRCDSGALLMGRGSVGPETNAPNTLATSICPDGNAGQFHSDGSIDRIQVWTPDGSPFEAGKNVIVGVSVWGRITRPGESLKLFVAGPDLATPTWTPLSGQGLGNIIPGPLSTSFVFAPPFGKVAVRAVMTPRETDADIPCLADPDSDRDDLVFTVGDTIAPAVSVTSPAEGDVVWLTSQVVATVTDAGGVQKVELLIDGAVRTILTAPPYSFSWDTTAYAAGNHRLDVRATDVNSNVSTVTRNVVVFQDTQPPVLTLTAPAAGTTLAGMVTVTGTVTDNGGPIGQVRLVRDGTTAVVATVVPSGNQFSFVWDTTKTANGPFTLQAQATDNQGNVGNSAPLALTASNPGVIAYDAALGAPRCPTPVAQCDSFELLNGRGPVGPEPHTPNTLAGSCADGVAGQYHVDESIDRIRVSSLDGAPLEAGRDAKIDVTVWPNSGSAGSTTDSVTFFAAADATNPTWTPIGLATPANLHTALVIPQGFTLSNASLQAVRVVVHRGIGGPNLPCMTGMTDDHDDLVFTVGDTTAPTVSIDQPANGATVSGTVHIAFSIHDVGAISSSALTIDGTLVALPSVGGSYGYDWNTSVASNGPHVIKFQGTDAHGNTASVTTNVTVNNAVAPVVTLTSPAAGAFVSGTVPVGSTIVPGAGTITSVQLLADNAVVATSTSAPFALSWNTTTFVDGAHTLRLHVLDSLGRTGDSATVTLSVDNTLPTVALIAPAAGASVGGTVAVAASASDAGAGIASVALLVDGALVSTVTGAGPYAWAWNSASVSAGAHVLTARATDLAGNQRSSANVSVTVDNVAPTVALTSPTAGARVAATITVTAAASDVGGAVASVAFLLDGAVTTTVTGAGPYTWAWNSTTASAGAHVLAARATDLAGNQRSSAGVAVTVDNVAPTVAVTSPASGASVRGTVTVTVTASDAGTGVGEVLFLLDGVVTATVTGAGPYTWAWNSTTASAGTHVLDAQAADLAGNQRPSLDVAVTVDNVAPTVAVTTPATGASVTGTITVTAVASDAGTGVASVAFLLDGAVTATVTGAGPYGWSWNTTTATPGSHTLTARAADALGNQQTSAPVAVTVVAPCVATSGTGTGLRGEYFDNADLTAWRSVRTDASVNFDWGTGAPITGIGADTFSVRWTGDVQPRYSGTYTFTATANDGVRVWVNGTQIINRWTNTTTAVATSGTITLTGGQRYPIKIEHFDNTGAASAVLAWTSGCQAAETVPQSQLYPATIGTGLKGEYFDNADLTGTLVVRNDPTINFSWGTGAPIAGIGADTFSVRWTGNIDLPSNETYTFFTTSDDGVRLWVNGTQIINNWTTHTATQNSGTITLGGGQTYAIRMEYFDNTSTATAQLSWSTPTITKQAIPAVRLIPAP